jgi:hypothetical protein
MTLSPVLLAQRPPYPARNERTLITMLHQHVSFAASPNAFFIYLSRQGAHETGRSPCNV